MGMKALSLWQPHATLVALNIKRIESRSWATSYRGPLAIHAAKRVVMGPIGDYYAETWFTNVQHVADCYCDPGEIDVPCQRGATRTPCLTQRGEVAAELPLGAVVATCILSDVVPIVGSPMSPDERQAANIAGIYLLRAVGGLGREILGLFRAVDGYGIGGTNGNAAEHPFTAEHPYDDLTEQMPYGDYTVPTRRQPKLRYAWLLTDVVPLDPPVPAKGRQGLWTWDGVAV